MRKSSNGKSNKRKRKDAKGINVNKRILLDDIYDNLTKEINTEQNRSKMKRIFDKIPIKLTKGEKETTRKLRKSKNKEYYCLICGDFANSRPNKHFASEYHKICSGKLISELDPNVVEKNRGLRVEEINDLQIYFHFRVEQSGYALSSNNIGWCIEINQPIVVNLLDKEDFIEEDVLGKYVAHSLIKKYIPVKLRHPMNRPELIKALNPTFCDVTYRELVENFEMQQLKSYKHSQVKDLLDEFKISIASSLCNKFEIKDVEIEIDLYSEDTIQILLTKNQRKECLLDCSLSEIEVSQSYSHPLFVGLFRNRPVNPQLMKVFMLKIPVKTDCQNMVLETEITQNMTIHLGIFLPSDPKEMKKDQLKLQKIMDRAKEVRHPVVASKVRYFFMEEKDLERDDDEIETDFHHYTEPYK